MRDWQIEILIAAAAVLMFGLALHFSSDPRRADLSNRPFADCLALGKSPEWCAKELQIIFGDSPKRTLGGQ